MKKKLVSATLALLMGAVALTGCNTVTTEEAGEATGSAAPAAEGAAAEGSSADSMKGNGDKTLNVFLYMQEHEKEIYKGLVEEFVEEHKDEIKEVVFEVTTQDEYNTKMIANMTAGDMPDVFYVGPAAVRSYVDNGYILPLDDYVDAATVEKIWGTTQTIYRYDGTNVGTGSLYALPKDLSCFAFAYNKDLFDEAGLAYPDPEKPYTYDEFIEVCKALTKDKDGDGETDQWGVANANQFGMTPYLYSNGVKFLNDDMTKVNVANNEALKNALTFYTDLTLNGLTPSVDQDTALGGYQRWLDGQIGFYACGTWDIAAFMDDSTFPYEWDLCGWPVGPDGDGRSHTWMGSVGYCVSKTTENPDLCAELIAKLFPPSSFRTSPTLLTASSSMQSRLRSFRSRQMSASSSATSKAMTTMRQLFRRPTTPTMVSGSTRSGRVSRTSREATSRLRTSSHRSSRICSPHLTTRSSFRTLQRTNLATTADPSLKRGVCIF